APAVAPNPPRRQRPPRPPPPRAPPPPPPPGQHPRRPSPPPGRNRPAGPPNAPGHRQPARHRNNRPRGNPVSDLRATADRAETEAIPGEFTGAVTIRDYHRLAPLPTPDRAAPNPPSATSRPPARRRSPPWPAAGALANNLVPTTHRLTAPTRRTICHRICRRERP